MPSVIMIGFRVARVPGSTSEEAVWLVADTKEGV
jgi:hypothetical protein